MELLLVTLLSCESAQSIINDIKLTTPNREGLVEVIQDATEKGCFEVIIANGFDESALKILKTKKNLRLIDSSNFTLNEMFKINYHLENLDGISNQFSNHPIIL